MVTIKDISLGQRKPSQREQINTDFGQKWKVSAGRSLGRFANQRKTPFLPTAENRRQS